MKWRQDLPYCVEICHHRREYAFRNRDYSRVGSEVEHYFSPFPEGSKQETTFLYTDRNPPDKANYVRTLQRKLTVLLETLCQYTEV